MDVSTFYALFSATCFTLVGLWWNVIEHNKEWLRSPAQRRTVGGIYLSFLLPALMGLFAQVGGTATPIIWRLGFVVIAIIGCVSTLRLLRQARAERQRGGWMGRHHWAIVVIYALIAVTGVVPELARGIGLTPLQGEAILLILLIVVAHALVWEFMSKAIKEPAAR